MNFTALVISGDEDGSTILIAGAIVLFVVLPIVVGIVWRVADRRSRTDRDDDAT